jgi:hypothetical protein
MRRFVLLLPMLSALITTQVRAQTSGQADFNFEELMEGVELNLNEMQASLSLQDKADAIARSVEIKQSFHTIELFFAAWGYADDAVTSAKEYQQRSDRIIELIEAGDFDAAYDVSVEHSNRCKSCHDNYKPLP